MAIELSKADRAAQLARDIEIVRRWRTSAPSDGTVVAVKDAWKSGILYQIATVETDRGQATIETMASVYRSGRALDFPPESFILEAPWIQRFTDRCIKSIGWVHVGDTVALS